MWNYAACRLLWLIPTLFGVSIIMFSLLHVVPGDPLAGVLPLQAGPEEREKLRHELGFDRPVSGEVVDALGNTFILAITAGVLSMVLGTILGTIAGFQQGRWADKLASAIAKRGKQALEYVLRMVAASDKIMDYVGSMEIFRAMVVGGHYLVCDDVEAMKQIEANGRRIADEDWRRYYLLALRLMQNACSRRRGK